jgi:biopolymer transport protein ExbD
MAFKNKQRQKEKVELVSLIDMIFILLAFFLVTNFVIRVPQQERNLYIPTPDNTPGNAQIMIQFINEEEVFWIDSHASDVVESMERELGFLPNEILMDTILTALLDRNILTLSQLDEKIENLKSDANDDPELESFVLVRCPNNVPYFRVIDVIVKLSNTLFQNLKYGCVGGTVEEISKIRTVIRRDRNGSERKNIVIEFGNT